MKKISGILAFMLSVPMIYADECGITNLASCLPEKFFQYILTLVNAPFQPFLSMIKSLLSEPVNIAMLMPFWAIIIYLISIFYGLFMLIAGFNFLISGYSAEKRSLAKEWLKNVVLMILFIQSSYYLYSILIELSSQLTVSVFNMINPDFFLFSIDNLASFSLELIFSSLYMVALVFCILLLSIRYVLVSIGLIFFPIGIFLNFIPPLQSYGKLILNILMIMVFLPFVESLILLGASMLISVPIFENLKILVMISAMLLVSLSMLLLAFFAIAKAAFSVINSPMGKTVKMISASS